MPIDPLSFPLSLSPFSFQVRSAARALSTSIRPDTAIEVELEKEVWELEECPTLFQYLRLTPNPKSPSQSPWIQLYAPARHLDHKLFQYAINALLGIYGK